MPSLVETLEKNIKKCERFTGRRTDLDSLGHTGGDQKSSLELSAQVLGDDPNKPMSRVTSGVARIGTLAAQWP